MAEALASDVGPGANLARLSDFFAAQQRRGRVRSGLAPTVLAEGFGALTGSYVMSRLMLGARPDDATFETLDALVDLFCDGALGEARS